MFIEIGGAHDGRHSTAAQHRSRLTFQATASQVFSPSLGLPSIPSPSRREALIRVKEATTWNLGPRRLKSPTLRLSPAMAIRLGPCLGKAGVSEARHRRVHPIPVVDGLDSHPPLPIDSGGNHAERSEIGRLSSGKGGLPL